MKSTVPLVALLSITLLLTACASKPVQVAGNDRFGEGKTGAQLFVLMCANCHGETARGDGPVAPFLIKQPTDLTRLAQRNNGWFMADKIHQVIDGRLEAFFHGPREMPVWGQRLLYRADRADPAANQQVDAQISLLVEYIRSIQQL